MAGRHYIPESNSLTIDLSEEEHPRRLLKEATRRTQSWGRNRPFIGL